MSSIRWLRPTTSNSPQIWGFKSGIQVGIWPFDIEGNNDGGPRGLFRIGYPILDGGRRAGLVNFVAVEPFVGGVRCFSELEPSGLKPGQGKLFWTASPEYAAARIDAGKMEGGTEDERLSVVVYIEPFVNGASPVVELRFYSHSPDEVHFIITSSARSAQMERCVLTATMGNYMRLRRLHLRDHDVHPRDLWPAYHGNAFTEDALFPAHLLPTNHAGDLMACAAADEKDPHAQPADRAAPWWRYRGSFPVTQYWRMPKGTWSDKLQARVNGRCVYWGGAIPIPGGMAFENFDLVSPFQQNQEFVFGVSRHIAEALVKR